MCLIRHERAATAAAASQQRPYVPVSSASSTAVTPAAPLPASLKYRCAAVSDGVVAVYDADIAADDAAAVVVVPAAALDEDVGARTRLMDANSSSVDGPPSLCRGVPALCTASPATARWECDVENSRSILRSSSSIVSDTLAMTT